MKLEQRPIYTIKTSALYLAAAVAVALPALPAIAESEASRMSGTEAASENTSAASRTNQTESRTMNNSSATVRASTEASRRSESDAGHMVNGGGATTGVTTHTPQAQTKTYK